jgi:hypothetical protein
MMETVWICEKHFKELCEKLDDKVIIMPIYNILRDKCGVANCTETGDHLIYQSDIAKL